MTHSLTHGVDTVLASTTVPFIRCKAGLPLRFARFAVADDGADRPAF
jgi:hypothetical protein